MAQGIYLDKWIVDLLAVDYKMFVVTAYIVAKADGSGNVRSSYHEIADGTGLTYKQVRNAVGQVLGHEKGTIRARFLGRSGMNFTIYSNYDEKAQELDRSRARLGHEKGTIEGNQVETPPTRPNSFISTKPYNSTTDSITTTNKENNPPITHKGVIAPLIKGEADKPKIKKFVKPTMEQVKDYCTERKNYVDPDRFWNFYESKGWVVGKSPMKDWKAAVRTWEKSTKKIGAHGIEVTGETTSILDDIF